MSPPRAQLQMPTGVIGKAHVAQNFQHTIKSRYSLLPTLPCYSLEQPLPAASFLLPLFRKKHCHVKPIPSSLATCSSVILPFPCCHSLYANLCTLTHFPRCPSLEPLWGRGTILTHNKKNNSINSQKECESKTSLTT